MLVRVERIIKLYHPIKDDVWGTGRIPNWMVHKRVRMNNTYDYNKRSISSSHHHPSPWQHAGRIAYFVINGWEDSILVEVGIPGRTPEKGVLVDDGNHRLSAAWFRGDTFIDVLSSGDDKAFSELLIEAVLQKQICLHS